jgi:hypothetical protein
MKVAVASGVDGLDLVVGREMVAERAAVLHELGHAPAPIELFQHLDDGFALRGRPREAHGISKLVLWNINRRLHASTITWLGIQIKAVWNPLDDVTVEGARLESDFGDHHQAIPKHLVAQLNQEVAVNRCSLM